MEIAFELTVKGIFEKGKTQLTVIGNWEQVNMWKGKHKQWQIVRVQNGQRIMLAQSFSFSDYDVSGIMRLQSTV